MIHKEQQLDYMHDPAIYFERLRDEPWAIWLDSAHVSGSRYDILIARPYKTLVTRGAETTITDAQGVTTSKREPLQLIDEALQVDETINTGLPFSGGAAGYFGYGLTLAGGEDSNLRTEKRHAVSPPDMAVGLYNCAITFDHLAKIVTLSGLFDEHDDDIDSRWNSLLQKVSRPPEPHSDTPFTLDGPFEESLPYDQYRQAFAKIQHYLQEGDCYQVNLTQRFSAPCHGDMWPLYRQLRQRNPAPYGAYMQLGDIELLSFSPEQFLKVSQRQVTTSPIKGTRPRSGDSTQDQQTLNELQQSEKDRAENLMIVDLLRNDLGRCCRVGSIRVPKLFFTESHPNVHHLVSTISAELAEGKSAIDLLRGCFPGGSITGAPKIRAMEIIGEVEPVPRHIYCGAMGYIGFDGSMETNIAIRTAYRHSGTLSFHAGGGIIADSNVEAEYQELFDKAGFFLNYFDHPKKPRK